MKTEVKEGHEEMKTEMKIGHKQLKITKKVAKEEVLLSFLRQGRCESRTRAIKDEHDEYSTEDGRTTESRSKADQEGLKIDMMISQEEMKKQTCYRSAEDKGENN